MQFLSSLKIQQPYIALFGSGSSVNELDQEAFAAIKASCFTITCNYAPMKIKGHLNIWSDRKVSEFLEQYYRKHPKECLFLVRHGRATPGLRKKVDYWFNQKHEKLRGNYTVVWALQLLQKYFPEKTILLFGIDMYYQQDNLLKWYDNFTDFDRKKRGKKYDANKKLAQCALQLQKYVLPEKIINCNPKSKLQHFPKLEWRQVLQLKVLHLTNTPLAGAPTHLSRIINKYTACKSKTVLKNPFKGARTKNLQWEYDVVSPSTKKLEALIEEADIIHYHQKPYVHKVPGKKSLIQFHAQPRGYQPGQSLSEFNDRKLVIAQYHPRYYTDALVVPNLIDIWDEHLQPEIKPDSLIKIFYSWATEVKKGWGNKGSAATIGILNRLKEKHGSRVAIKILNNRPYEECLREKRTAHICIDECVTGSYHLQSLEGCSVGALTFNNIDEQTHAFLNRVSGQDQHPFMTADLSTLEERLDHYIRHPEILSEKGQAARAWMERYWNPKNLLYRYIDAYHNVLLYNQVRPIGKQPAPVIMPKDRPRQRSVQPAETNSAPKYSIEKLHEQYLNRDIYLFGPRVDFSTFDPKDFKDAVCIGINYLREPSPFLDYVLIDETEHYQKARQAFGSDKLILPNRLIVKHSKAPGVPGPKRLAISDQKAFIYPIQDSYRKNLAKKHLDLGVRAGMFTWYSLWHSAIHIAAYLGAKNIFLRGLEDEYTLPPNDKSHKTKAISRAFIRKNQQGLLWLRKKLAVAGINLIYENGEKNELIPILPDKVPTPSPPVESAIKANIMRRSIQELHGCFTGEDIYIFGTGPSLLSIDPEAFKNKICFGINFSFEKMPYMDFILAHVYETYEAIRKVVDNDKLLLPETLVKQWHRQSWKNTPPYRREVQNTLAYFYPIQDPHGKNLKAKHVDLHPDTEIFTWSSTTHSAIHLAAYMGAKNIYLVGVDYKLFPNGLVHFKSKYDSQYDRQDWHALAKHRQGDQWLTQELGKSGIPVRHFQSEVNSFKTVVNGKKEQNAQIQSAQLQSPEKQINKVKTAAPPQAGTDKKPLLSICITVHNRSKTQSSDGQYQYIFPNCLKSLMRADRDGLQIEVIISDFKSKDWPLEEWVGEVLHGIPYRIINSDATFHNGLGRNIAADAAKGEFLLFLDADMVIPESFLRTGMNYLQQGKAYFPICFYYLNEEESLGFWCDGGKGVSFMPRSTYLKTGKWPSPPQYKLNYNVDQHFFKKIKASDIEIVNKRMANYFHQYHPGRSVDTIFKKRKQLIRSVKNGMIGPVTVPDKKNTATTDEGGSHLSSQKPSDKASQKAVIASTAPAKTVVEGNQKVTACLLSYRRSGNIHAIVKHLHAFDFIDEILIWNNDPSAELNISGDKVRVINSGENKICYGRFLCAKEARNEYIFVQDDDVIVRNLRELYHAFLADDSRITHALIAKHYKLRARYDHGCGQVALLGWGAFFKRSWIAVLDQYLAVEEEDHLFRREADKFFTLLLKQKHQTLQGSVKMLQDHATPGIALYLETKHELYKALAVRKALAYLRGSDSKSTVLPWNVVIPCRNYGHYLKECVQSVLHNKADYHITIVNDNSTDDTAAVAQEFTAAYPFISYLENEIRKGVSFCRNRGLDHRKSSYALCLDADDKIGADYLFQSEKLLRSGCDVANPDAILFGTHQARWQVPETVTLDMLRSKNPVHVCAAFKMSYWGRTDGYDEDMPGSQDYEFWIQMAKAGAVFKRLPGDHFYYRKHGPSISDISRSIRADIERYLREKHKDLFEAPEIVKI